MTWQLASFLLLGAVLAAGFAWYERSRPSARVLSLVAATAALAVVGRLAFAAFPNVKPTTDIVLFAGFALGPVPGFAVGALTALVSNVFLGHGPWTPWQMVAWGGVGVAGGLLAKLYRGRQPGRIVLAAVCGIAGLAFGALLDVYQWSFTAERSLDSYRVVAETSLPYNLAHAIGNVAFALVLGPAFVRALRRYRERFEVRLVPLPATLALALALVLALPAAALATSRAGERAAAYVERAQNRDGGFGPAPGAGSTELYTGWAALGLAAAGRNPADVRRRTLAGTGGRTALDAVRAGARSGDTGELERTILVVGAAGRDPHDFAGRDLVAALLRKRRSDGSFEGLTNLTAFGVLALRAAGEPPARGAVRSGARFLERARNEDGGFGFSPRAVSDVDVTGAVLQALAAAGRARGEVAQRAVGFLRGAQNEDGGFGSRAGAESNAQSTAWAVQGLLAARRDPARVRTGGRDPLSYLRGLQQPSGEVRYSRTSSQTPVWVTSQALLALERRAFPLAPVRRARGSAPRPGAAPARSERQPDRPPRERRGPRRRDARGPEPAAAAPPTAVEVTPAAVLRRASTASGAGAIRSGLDPVAGLIALALTGAAGLGIRRFVRRARRRGTPAAGH